MDEEKKKSRCNAFTEAHPSRAATARKMDASVKSSGALDKFIRLRGLLHDVKSSGALDEVIWLRGLLHDIKDQLVLEKAQVAEI